MDPKAWSGREVVNVGPKGVRRWVARLKGAEVETTARTGAGKPRVAVKAYASGMAAGAELIKTLRKKMLEDFVYLRPEAGVGELFFAMALPGGGPADNFDVSADGQVLFVGAGRGDPRAQLVRASLSTGEVQRFEVVANPGDRQLFIHGALVSADGASGVYGLGAGVRAVDLASGAWRAVASVLHRGQEHVNPFCVEPQRDAAQQRVLLVDGENLEVRAWGSGARIFQVPIGTATAECRRIALSPSGAREIGEYRTSGRVALFLGAEGPGLPSSVLAALETVRIRMAKGFDSLNVAAASAIALHHFAQNRWMKD